MIFGRLVVFSNILGIFLYRTIIIFGSFCFILSLGVDSFVGKDESFEFVKIDFGKFSVLSQDVYGVFIECYANGG